MPNLSLFGPLYVTYQWEICVLYLWPSFYLTATPNKQTNKTQEVPAAAATTTPPAGELKLRLVIEKPEIVMVENPLKYDTEALILDVSDTSYYNDWQSYSVFEVSKVFG